MGNLSWLLPVEGSTRTLAVELDFVSTIMPDEPLQLISSTFISGRFDGIPVAASSVTLQVIVICDVSQPA